MFRYVYCHSHVHISKVYGNKQYLIFALSEESILFMLVHLPSVYVGIHQIEEFSTGDTLFLIADVQKRFVEVPYTFLFGIKQVGIKSSVVSPAPYAVNAPIVEYCCSSVSAAKSFRIHSAFAKLLSEVYHDWVCVHACRYYHSRECFVRVSCKIIGCNTLFVVVFQEIKHVTLNVVHTLPATCYVCSG